MKQEDTIEQMLKHFCLGRHNVVLKNDKGAITHMVSQWLFINFLDTNLHMDWFPQLLNTPIYQLHVIIPRFALFLLASLSYLIVPGVITSQQGHLCYQ